MVAAVMEVVAWAETARVARVEVQTVVRRVVATAVAAVMVMVVVAKAEDQSSPSGPKPTQPAAHS